jgi:hypothetical protein
LKIASISSKQILRIEHVLRASTPWPPSVTAYRNPISRHAASVA